jgi:hypothetical protein
MLLPHPFFLASVKRHTGQSRHRHAYMLGGDAFNLIATEGGVFFANGLGCFVS